MGILITNIALDARTGTEILTRDLAVEMRRRGHECVIYTHAKGMIADWLADNGFYVTDSIASVAGPFDVIHGHHSTVAGIAAIRFPNVPAIFVCHDFTAWHDAPPKLRNFTHFVAIGPTSAQRLAQNGVPPERMTVIPNGVDQDRFRPGPPLPDKCGRALAFCKSKKMVKPIKDACRRRGIIVDFAGYGAGNPIEDPERVMPTYDDLIFCSGLTAREALCCRRAVICCDDRGLGGMVSLHSLKEWDNNLGLRVLTKVPTTENFVREIDRYNSADATRAADAFAAGCSMTDCARLYEEVYGAAIAEGVTAAGPADFADIPEYIETFSRKPESPRFDRRKHNPRAGKIRQLKQVLLDRLIGLFIGSRGDGDRRYHGK